VTLPSRDRPRTNWAGNIKFSPARFERPASIDELADLVAAAPQVRVLGTGHSFNDIADTTGLQLSVVGLPEIISLDQAARTVTVSAGTTYGRLGAVLQAEGFALANTGSLPHISVAGACSTGTHGSGDTLQNLSAMASAVELLTADGSVSTLRRSDGDRFNGAVLALGALGVITRLELDVVPTFDVRQDVYDGLDPQTLGTALDEVMSAAYSVSVFTSWRRGAPVQVWRKRRVNQAGVGPAEDNWLGARLADGPRHPLPGMAPENATAQLGVGGPWNERLPHFRLEFTPSAGEELQSEYLVPRTLGADAWLALEQLGDRISEVLLIGEIRSIAADPLWISPGHQRDSIAFHFTWRPDLAAVLPVLAEMEAALAPMDARPHWGKIFTTPPSELPRLYPRLDDFRALAADLDPERKFANEFLITNVLDPAQ
jgi:alditol oxidase